MIKFIHTQSNGDATSNYDIDFPKGMTIAEFVEAVRKERSCDWWGYFYFPGFEQIGEYRNEKMTIKKKYRDIKPTSIWANGGWGYMSYYFTEEEEKNGD